MHCALTEFVHALDVRCDIKWDSKNDVTQMTALFNKIRKPEGEVLGLSLVWEDYASEDFCLC